MKFSWKAFSFLSVFASLAAYAGPTSTFNDGNQVYRMNFTTSLVLSSAIPESDYLITAVKHSGFLIGDLAYIHEKENQNAIGSPLRVDGDVKIAKVEKRADGSSEVFYTYDGEVVLNRTGLNHYLLYLPTEYESLTKLPKTELGVCSIYKTANSLPILDMLIPYWNPFINPRNCKIAYREITASLTPVADTNAYPDYPRLVKDGEIKISVFFAKMTAGDPNHPLSSVFGGGPRSGSVQEYQEFVKRLKKQGFVRTELIQNQGNQTNYQEIYRLDLPRAKIRVHLVYGDAVHQGPAMGEYSALYVKAAQEDSVVLYSGHSGFLIDASGLNFYSDMQIQWDQDRYQIFSMNGCQTNYYLLPMFQKKSSKNFDIFVNALEVYANYQGSLSPITAIVNWADHNQWTSYKDLARQMDFGKGMTGVVGEHDNPTAPY
jgi:hypothetical protein